MVEHSHPSTKHVFLFIASFLPCKDHVYRLSVTSKSLRSAFEYSGLTKNESSFVLGQKKGVSMLRYFKPHKESKELIIS